MVRKLQSKMNEETEHKFNLVRVIKAHLLPITNVAFNKLSTLFATGKFLLRIFLTHFHQVIVVGSRR